MQRLYMEFGQRLRRARKDARLTQNEVANRVGLTRTSVTNIERGRQHIALHQLFLLASAVGSQPEDLLPDGAGALEDLLAPEVLQGLHADTEERDFAARVIGKQRARQESEKAEVKK